MTAPQERLATVLGRERREPYMELVLDLGAGAHRPDPGQFYMLTPPAADAFFPRPMSFVRFDAARHAARFLFSVVGRGTDALARLCPGETLPVLGPLGRPFRFHAGATHLLVGGGRGIAPLVEAAHRAGAERLPVVWLAGARSRQWLYEPAGLPVERYLTCTDDGTSGRKGLVTDLLEEELGSRKGEVAVLGCGPHAMLRKVAAICNGRSVACQVSLEGPMACGLGLCRGCPIPVRTGKTPDPVPPLDPARPTPDGIRYAMCCQDGPVFDAREVLWEWLT